MPQVVEPAARQSRTLEDPLERSRHVPAVQRTARTGGEDQVAFLPLGTHTQPLPALPRAVIHQLASDELRHRNTPVASAALQLHDLKGALEPLELNSCVDDQSVKIDVLPLEPK